MKRRTVQALPPRDVLTTPQAAEFLAVSTQFLEIARVKGGGPPFTRVGRLVRYRRSTLEAWLAAREVNSTSAAER